jgi:EAL domain-containing protein (putative c-di-GMP-specific phosphodiesterase class I)
MEAFSDIDTTDLSGALERGEFRVVYQPVIDVRTGHISSFEALVRWQHPTKGLLPPAEFMLAAEETGVVAQIGSLVLGRAVGELSSLRQRGSDAERVSVSVNVSKAQLLDDGLVSQVTGLLATNAIAPHRLTLEVSEHVLMDDADAVAPALRILRRAGVQVAMDDFTASNVSLARLHGFPLDCLKIDRSVTCDMALSREDAAIGHAIVALAHNLGLSVIAKGVESPEQFAMLQAFGFDGGQGFFFSRPVSAESLPALLTHGWSRRSA